VFFVSTSIKVRALIAMVCAFPRVVNTANYVLRLYYSFQRKCVMCRSTPLLYKRRRDGRNVFSRAEERKKSLRSDISCSASVGKSTI
jgi:hypothetical protein